LITPFPGLLGATVVFAVWFPAGANKQVGRNMAFWLPNDPRRLPVKRQADLAVGSFVMVLREAR
jgi:hypothetical protein